MQRPLGSGIVPIYVPPATDARPPKQEGFVAARISESAIVDAGDGQLQAYFVLLLSV